MEGGYGGYEPQARQGPPKREFEHRNDIVEIGRRLYQKGFIAAADGNISVRMESDRILTTPSGMNKGRLTPEDLVVTDSRGRLLYGKHRPSSELEMHLVMYQERADVNSVVHAHPPHASGFAVAGLAMDQPLLSEVILTLGTVPLAEYGTPTTPELAEAVRPHAGHDGILLANHGALTAGKDLFQAYDRMETLEHSAHIFIVARILGSERPLSEEHVSRLRMIRDRVGFEPPTRACLSCKVLDEKVAGAGHAPGPADAKTGAMTFTQEQLVELITDVVKGL